MATCNVEELQSEACISGFGCNISELEFRILLLQLLCNLADGGGGGGGIGGTVAIANGAESGTVSGLALAGVPNITLTVIRQTGNLFLTAALASVPTADGFDYELSGITDTADYLLSYTGSIP